MTDFNWAEGDRVEVLKDLWGKGYSCAQIAAHFDFEPSRSAVMGKVHRLNLPQRSQDAVRASAKARRWGKASPKPLSPPASPTKALVVAILPTLTVDGQPFTLETISDKTCRWPIGDPAAPDFHFCGHTPRSGHPYCDAHCTKAYQPSHAAVRAAETHHREALRPGQTSLWR